MRFREGSRVEVLRRNKESYGSWVPARILSKDGCRYMVRYELLLTGKGDPVEEKVHEKYIRPCPPLLSNERWGFGDIAEVFDVHSWRVGKIAKVLQNKWFGVRLCGSVQLKKFHVSDMRIQQAWHDNQWISLGKGNGNDRLFDSSKGVAHLGSEANDVILEEVCTRGRYKHDNVKKLPPYNNLVRGNKKRRLNSEERERHPPVKRSSLSNDLVGKHCVHSSSTPSQFVEESIECSVASCSADNFYDDTRCPSGTGRGCLSVTGDELAASIHELELHAYETTMKALFASGILTWELESLLTNLRLSLHISNEEHLHQLKHLLST